jgi:hypothetical protein
MEGGVTVSHVSKYCGRDDREEMGFELTVRTAKVAVMTTMDCAKA